MTYKITIPGKPQAKGRHRSTKKGIQYTPENTISYENLIKTIFYNKYNSPLLSGYIKLNIYAFFNIPKSTPKTKKSQMLSRNLKPDKKPDLDNIAKIVMDALNDIAYIDDKQIVNLSIIKEYSDIPRLEIELKILDYDNRAKKVI